MRNAIWLVDVESNGTRAEQLKAVIEKRGFAYRAVKFFPENRFTGDIAGAENIPLDARVVYFGGPALMRHIQTHRRWRPGGWCTFENFSCHTYYSYFGQYLLNEDYTLLPAAEALRHRKKLFDMHARSGDVFMRPSIGRKLFVEASSTKTILRERSLPSTLVHSS